MSCFVPPSHDMYGRVGPSAFALLHEIAEFAASVNLQEVFMENAMHNLSTTVSPEIARHVLASAPL